MEIKKNMCIRSLFFFLKANLKERKDREFFGWKKTGGERLADDVTKLARHWLPISLLFFCDCKFFFFFLSFFCVSGDRLVFLGIKNARAE